MNIAITGGAGLIGTELCKIFSQEHNVTVLDFKEPKIPGINFIKIDIENTQEIIDSTKGIDVIIHLAAALGVIETEKNPVKTLDINSIGTKNVLEACKTNNIKKNWFSGTKENIFCKCFNYRYGRIRVPITYLSSSFRCW